MGSEATPVVAADAALSAAIDRSLRHPVMFFLTSGTVWLAVSIVLAVIASVKVHYPVFWDGCGFFTYGRVFPAHLNTLVYGWGFQAGFAVMLWLVARTTGQPCRTATTILVAGHAWNASILSGTLCILGGVGTGMPWMEFPVFVWPLLLVSYIAIVLGSFVQFRIRRDARFRIPQWYLLAAMLWFPWVFSTANLLVHGASGHPLMAAAINAWYKSGITFLFFVPLALGAACFLAPELTSRAIPSRSLARLGFWSLALVAPWAGMQKLAGAPIPVFLPYLGAAATALLAVPLATQVFNILRVVFTHDESVPKSPALNFTLAGLFATLLLAVSAIATNLPDPSLKLTQFSITGYGLDILAVYGCFSFSMFGVLYHIVPRITCRPWPSRRLANMHFFFSVYGLAAISFGSLFGGFIHGSAVEAWQQPWSTVTGALFPYAAITTFGWCVVLFSNIFFGIQLVLMWRAFIRPADGSMADAGDNSTQQPLMAP